MDLRRWLHVQSPAQHSTTCAHRYNIGRSKLHSFHIFCDDSWHAPDKQAKARSGLKTCCLLQELLGINVQQNLQLVVQVAKEYTEQLGAGKIIELLESHKSYHGLYYYLGASIAVSEDPEVRFLAPSLGVLECLGLHLGHTACADVVGVTQLAMGGSECSGLHLGHTAFGFGVLRVAFGSHCIWVRSAQGCIWVTLHLGHTAFGCMRQRCRSDGGVLEEASFRGGGRSTKIPDNSA